jgi:hypothetical protein
MQKLNALTIALLLSVTPTHIMQSNPANEALLNYKGIKLDAEILKFSDGSFINADTIGVMRSLQHQVRLLLLGDRDKNGNRVGRYEVHGKKYAVMALHELEKKNPNDPEIQKCLAVIIHDFIRISDGFSEQARGAKSMILQLIEESCQKRNRQDSLLLKWGSVSHEEEETIFRDNVKSVDSFMCFCTDLFNFFNDLIDSCPKALNKYNQRLEKWSKVRKMLPQVIANMKSNKEKINQNAFLSSLNQRLEKIKVEDITLASVKTMLEAFIKEQRK